MEIVVSDETPSLDAFIMRKNVHMQLVGRTFSAWVAVVVVGGGWRWWWGREPIAALTSSRMVS